VRWVIFSNFTNLLLRSSTKNLEWSGAETGIYGAGESFAIHCSIPKERPDLIYEKDTLIM
jgi:hypothetical protein